MNKKAVIIGASGLVGQELLLHLLNSEAYAKVYVLHYKQLSINHPKLQVLEIDFDDFESFGLMHKVDEAYCTIGTTIKKAGDIQSFRKVDVDYPISFAEWFKKQGGKSFSIVSAVSSNVDSSNYYNKAKGDVEKELKNMDFERLLIFKPSLLKGVRVEKRGLEKIGIYLMTLLNPLLLGGMKKYRMILTCDVAESMYKQNQIKSSNEVVELTWEEIMQGEPTI